MTNKKEFYNIIDAINFKNFFLGIILIICYCFFIPNLIVIFFDLFNLDLHNNTIYLIANFASYLTTLFLLLFIYRKSIFKEFKNYLKNFSSYSKTGLYYWFIGIVFMLISNSIIIAINGGLAANEAGNREIINALPVFSIISMAILGPIIEEFLFRKGFKSAFNSKFAFLLFTSILFGSMHLLASFTVEDFKVTQLLFIIPYSGFGYFFAKAYLKTNNIFTSVFAHMLHNSLSVLLVLFGV